MAPTQTDSDRFGRAATGSWLQPQPDPSLPVRLFCLPHAGAGAGAYRDWLDPLRAAGVAVCPIQLPGRETRFGEPLLKRLEDVLGSLIPALTPYLDVPFAVFGHSLGALLAFELTRGLRARGLPVPVALHVSGRIAPQVLDARRRLHALPEAELVSELTALGGIPRAILAEPELMRFSLPVLRADLAINETYRHRPEPPLALPITAWVGDSDPKVSPYEAGQWSEQTQATFQLRILPGGHFFLAAARGLVLRHLVADLRTGPSCAAAWRDAADD
jgi:medium-chain acyl-[acyl-carrier-protein] hydrolase